MGSSSSRNASNTSLEVCNASNSAGSNTLCEAGILQNVLSYVGPGHHLFLGAVSSQWRDLHSRVASRQTQVQKLFDSVSITCDARTTLYSSVFSSPSRVRLAHQSGLDCTTHAYKFAAGKHADINTLAAAHQLGMPFTATVLAGAAAVGALHKLIWLHAASRCALDGSIGEHAAMSGSISVLEWLKRRDITARSCWIAAHHNQLCTLQYLRLRHIPWDYRVCNAAARRGHSETLQWARTHGCPWDERYILYLAVSTGSLEMVAWVKQQPGVLCCANAMVAAARRGDTRMCEYLYTEGCAMSVEACYSAALEGDLDTLRFLREHGCPWDTASANSGACTNVCIAAAISGSVEVLQYLVEQQVQFSPDMLLSMLHHAELNSSNTAAVLWLQDRLDLIVQLMP
jgi:hypothetical protein